VVLSTRETRSPQTRADDLGFRCAKDRATDAAHPVR
jgi:hypothetical protein